MPKNFALHSLMLFQTSVIDQGPFGAFR